MKGISSILPSSSGSHYHACIVLTDTDRIRLIQFPIEIIDLIRQSIISHWSRGIQKEDPHPFFHDFKLRGNPWLGMLDQWLASRSLMFDFHLHST